MMTDKSLKTEIASILFFVGFIPFLLLSSVLALSVYQNKKQTDQSAISAKTQSQYAVALQLRQIQQTVDLLIQSNEIASLLNSPESMMAYTTNLFLAKVNNIQNSKDFKLENLLVLNNEDKTLFKFKDNSETEQLIDMQNIMQKKLSSGFSLDPTGKKIYYSKLLELDDQNQESASARKLGLMFVVINTSQILRFFPSISGILSLPSEIDPQKIDLSLSSNSDQSYLVFIFLIAITIFFVSTLILGGLKIKHKILDPIQKLNSQVQAQTPILEVVQKSVFVENEISQLEISFKQFSENIKLANDKLIEQQKNEVIADIARQVAHDIRSPLSALNMVMSTLGHLPEEKRLLIQNALNRIKDIANILLNKRSLIDAAKSHDEQKSVELLPAIIESLVSEKRFQYRDRMNLKIDTDFLKSYDCFCLINIKEIKRAISNLIDNAVEAIEKKTGTVSVICYCEDQKVKLIIQDNGKGIPSAVIAQIGAKGFSYGKGDQSNSGSGLGVFHAKQTFEKFGGILKIDSHVGQGTKVFVEFPQSQAPDWFAKEIKIPKDSILVVVDDDLSIHQIWQERFKHYISSKTILEVKDFLSLDEFEIWFVQNRNANFLLLIDYDFQHPHRNGLDVIEKFNVSKNAILTTSQFEEPLIRARAIKVGVRIVPKPMAALIPIN